MQTYEYKSVLLVVQRNWGLWKSKIAEDVVPPVEKELNKLGKEGWQLTGVFPLTDGGSPAQIERAIHHFMRPIPS